MMGGSHESLPASQAAPARAQPEPARAAGRPKNAAQDEPARLDARTLLSLQASAGNQAVGLLLQRAAPGTVKATPPAAAAKPQAGPADAGTSAAFMDGKAADRLIDAFLQQLPGTSGAIRKPAEGHVQVEDAATFRAALLAYAEHRKKNNEPFRPDLDASSGIVVNAFEDTDNNIHIREGHGEFTTTLHEAFHLRSNDRFRDILEFNANEGLTEYWTRRVCTENHLDRGDLYSEERGGAEELVKAAGVEAVAAGYFTGNLGIVKLLYDKEVRAVKGARARTPFFDWRNAMKRGAYDEAKKVVWPTGSTP